MYNLKKTSVGIVIIFKSWPLPQLLSRGSEAQSPSLVEGKKRVIYGECQFFFDGDAMVLGSGLGDAMVLEQL